MSFQINKRPIPPPRDPPNRSVIDAIRFAVDELGGATSRTQRAVRIGELIEARLLEFKADGTIGAPTIGNALSMTTDLQFVGKNRRILGDLSSNPIISRLLLQTSLPNQASNMGVIPNGTATTALYTAFNSSDPDNAGLLQLRANATDMTITSTSTGSGVTRDLVISVGGERARFGADGIVYFSPGSGAHSLTIGTPGATPGFVGTYTNTKRRDIRFTDTGIEFGMSASTSIPALAIKMNESGQLIVQGSSSVGSVVLSSGSATNLGHVSFFTQDGVRRGYIGWGDNTSSIIMQPENGWHYKFAVGAEESWPTINDNKIGFRDIPRTTSWAQGQMFATTAGTTIGLGPPVGARYFIYNNSAAAITLTQGASFTLRLAGTTSTGNRTLAARGMAMLWYNTTSEAVLVDFGGLT